MELLALVAIVLLREFFYQREKQRTDRQIQSLLQRIQAPEVAIATFATEDHKPSPSMPLFTDEDYAKLMTSGD